MTDIVQDKLDSMLEELKLSMVTLELINKQGQVSFFTVTLDYKESFIDQMEDQGWLLLGLEYLKEGA